MVMQKRCTSSEWQVGQAATIYYQGNWEWTFKWKNKSKLTSPEQHSGGDAISIRNDVMEILLVSFEARVQYQISQTQSVI